MLIAAGVTYYMLLALAPALAVFVSIYGLFADRHLVEQQMNLLVGILPPGGIFDIINDQLTRLATPTRRSSAPTLVVSLLIALWSAGAGVRALIEAMNVAYDVVETRPFLSLNVLALVLTLGALATAVTFVAVVVVMPAVLHLSLPRQGLRMARARRELSA